MRQFLINFCENRMMGALYVFTTRALKYGKFSWQCKWTYKQEVFWAKLAEWLEGE